MSEPFYEHSFGKLLSKPRIHTVARLLQDTLKPPVGRPLDILDAGCGNMLNSEALAGILAQQLGVPVNLVGWDISETGVKEASRRGQRACLRDISRDHVSGDEASTYDVVLFIEVLEHVVDTDRSLFNMLKLLRPGGLLVLTTPNLASWYNRILLLLGFQPHCTEVSFLPQKFGCRWIGKLIDDGTGYKPAGHLRVFTWRALREFIAFFGFELLKARGVSNHGHDLVSRVLAACWVGGSGDIALVARKPVSCQQVEAQTFGLTE